MAKFVIEPHFRLQEWVAEEKASSPRPASTTNSTSSSARPAGASPDVGKAGAFQSIEKGREAERHLRLPLDGQRRGLARPHQALCRRLFGGAVGIFVPADLADPLAEDLAGVPISVGYQSGSHYATIQALEQYLPADRSTCRSARACCSPHGGFLDGKAPAPRCSTGRTTSPSSSASAR
jgi:hypothetical protein